jgi:hypothetical protein
MAKGRKKDPAPLREGETVEVVGEVESTTLKPDVPEIMVETTSKKKTPKIEDMFKKVGKISIKPYVDPNQENMGLEDYGMALFPGTYHEEQIAALEKNGVVRYITGLDEFAPEVQRLDNDTRDAVIKNIRMVVSFLEKQLASNVIKTDDEDFWDKVQLLKPNNHQFWRKISLRCGNEPLYLDPLNEAYDLIKFMAIEAGGFDLIAKSYDDALALPRPPKFFLDKETFTVSSRTTYKKLKNKAIGELDKLYSKNPKKLLYVTKVIDATSASYTVSTPIDILYDLLDEYIAGNGNESSRTKAAERFIETAQSDMETLKLRALVKDASFYNIISLKADGMLYHNPTSTMLGRNVSDVVQYLKNPLNEDVLINLLREIEEEYWNK